jgi:transcriptional regulator with XRE-family HTH domain
MKIVTQTTPEAIIAELGIRLAHRRIELGLTQAEVAKQAGVGKRTIERIEAGEDTQLTTLIRLLRILDLTDHLDQLIPEATVSPIEMLKQQQPQLRQRATPKRKTKSQKSWKWGDEE